MTFFPESCCGAIFDMDGTLLDSMHIWEQVDIDFLAAHGEIFTKDYGDDLKTLDLRQSAVYTIRRFGFDLTPAQVIAEWDALALARYENDLPAKPYAAAYLQTLREQSIRLALATVAPERYYMPALERTGLLPYLDVIIGPEDFPAGKNTPELFIHTASCMGLKPEECLVYEDTLGAAETAAKGGFPVCAVYDPASGTDYARMREIFPYYLTDFRTGVQH